MGEVRIASDDVREKYLEFLLHILHKARRDYRAAQDAHRTGELLELIGLTVTEFRRLILLDIENVIAEPWLEDVMRSLNITITRDRWLAYLEAGNILDILPGWMEAKLAERELPARRSAELERVCVGHRSLVAREDVAEQREADVFDKLLSRRWLEEAEL